MHQSFSQGISPCFHIDSFLLLMVNLENKKKSPNFPITQVLASISHHHGSSVLARYSIDKSMAKDQIQQLLLRTTQISIYLKALSL